jgi:hypothetical protein
MDWKFKKMVDTVCDVVTSGSYSKELINECLMHLANKTYQMGLDDAPAKEEVVPVTDLTHIPEVFVQIQKNGNFNGN